MRYKLLGRSGLKVSELCLGTMTFGEDWGWGASWEESKIIFDAFVKAGGNFIDTANRYTNGTSEKYVGELIASERERFVLATKFTVSENPADPNAGGNHRKSMVQSLNASLKRLKTHYIDLYWVHAWDTITPIDELMRALDDQVRAGKILYAGISDAPAWLIAQANTMASLKGWTPFTAMQMQYNLVERTCERELMPLAHAFDIAFLPWSPLAGGLLSGKYNKPKQELKRFTPDNPRTPLFVNDRNLAIAQAVIDIANEIHRTPTQVALNWIRQNEFKGAMIPIIGARNLTQMNDILGCLDFELSSDHMKQLNEISKISLGFPHDFLTSDMVRKLVHGDNFHMLDVHRD